MKKPNIEYRTSNIDKSISDRINRMDRIVAVFHQRYVPVYKKDKAKEYNPGELGVLSKAGGF